ncbi:hypothetical protein, partial [Kaistella pullorum]
KFKVRILYEDLGQQPQPSIYAGRYLLSHKNCTLEVMKKSTFLILTILLNYSCSKKHEEHGNKLEKKAEIYMTKELQKNDEYKKLNSIKVFKIDTLTEKSQAEYYYNYLYSKVETFIETGTNYSNVAKLEVEKSNYGDVSDKNIAKNNLELSYKYVDSAEIFEQKRQYLSQVHHKFDSLTPKFLEVSFAMDIETKNRSIIKDTAFLLFDLNSNIIDNKTFIQTIENKLNIKRDSR